MKNKICMGCANTATTKCEFCDNAYCESCCHTTRDNDLVCDDCLDEIDGLEDMLEEGE